MYIFEKYLYFSSFEAGNCVSNSSFKWRKIQLKQFSKTRVNDGVFGMISGEITLSHWHTCSHGPCLMRPLYQITMTNPAHWLTVFFPGAISWPGHQRFCGRCCPVVVLWRRVAVRIGQSSRWWGQRHNQATDCIMSSHPERASHY